MKLVPSTPEAYRLFHDGTLVLSQMEDNGMRVDEEYLDNIISEYSGKIRDLENDLRSDPLYLEWRKAFGQKTTIGSRQQLTHLLFHVLRLPYRKEWGLTKTERHRADLDVLGKIDLPIVRTFLRIQKLQKMLSTSLMGIKREIVNGYIHPFFSLAGSRDDDDSGGAQSFRSSSSEPNVQNQPRKDKEIAELVRRCIIPRDGNQLLEVDLGQAEVKSIAICSGDPILTAYATDLSKDMHYEVGGQIFLLKRSQVTKELRQIAKNLFVFREFYGGTYYQAAPDIWDAIQGMKVTIRGQEILLLEHLASHGITELGECDPKFAPQERTYERHLKKVEDDFRGRRFQATYHWRDATYNHYQTTGQFSLLTGFSIQNFHTKNQVANYQSQGIAFHWWLQTLIILQKWIDRHGLKARIINEIHDSGLIDCPPREVVPIIKKSRRIIERDLPRMWPWIVVPLTCEASVSPVGKSWWEKKVVG